MNFSGMGPGMQLDLENRAKRSIPFLAKSNRVPSKHNSQFFADTPGTDHDAHTPIRSERRERPEKAVANDSNLEKMVEDLGAKLAELTALVMAQQGSAPDESL